MARGPLHGVLVGALTPLCDGGAELDERAIEPLVECYVDAGVNGALVAGTTGEGLLLSRPERERLATRFVDAACGRFPVAVHAGAQSTAEALALALHAAEAGAAAVTAAAPPFFAFDQASLIAHFQALADACAPLPFYLYEIRQRTGYSISVAVVEALRDTAENLVGIKVSDPTIEELERYLLPGFDVLVGTESLVKEGFARGAVGALSGLAGALPADVVRSVADPGDRGATLGALRAGLERYPVHAAGKLALIAQNVALEPWVRPPLRQLTPAEHTDLEDWLTVVLAGSDWIATP
jgi:dihydrodipicolinate synthase/N-acetylneuraminate lyase